MKPNKDRKMKDIIQQIDTSYNNLKFDLDDENQLVETEENMKIG